MAKRRFNNLDGLRFIAATTVALSHLETLKQYRHLPFLHNRFFENSAQIAVTFFFVLSGFLIMWWFLEETGGDTTKINARTFYSNRIARTWPLYFLVVFVSIFISLINGTFAKDPLAVKRYAAYLLFLPNTADVFFQKDIFLSPAWSLAVEECFYFFFPLLLSKVRKEKLLQVLFTLSGVFILISAFNNRIIFNLLFPDFASNSIAVILTTFFIRYRFYSFLLGAAVAVMLFYNRLPAKFYNNKLYVTASGLLLGTLYINGITFSFLTEPIYSILVAGFISFMAVANKEIPLLNNQFFKWGGKISYGVYMLHTFVILRLINQGLFLLQVNNNAASIIISWVVCLALTLMLSHFSYKYFESPMRTLIRSALGTMKTRNQN